MSGGVNGRMVKGSGRCGFPVGHCFRKRIQINIVDIFDWPKVKQPQPLPPERMLLDAQGLRSGTIGV